MKFMPAAGAYVASININAVTLVPQYSAVPFCCTDVWFFLCDMLFTEINAAAADILPMNPNCD